MTLGDLVNGGVIKMSTRIVLSTDLSSGISTPDTLGEMLMGQYTKYKDRKIVSLSGVGDKLNIIIEDDYMLS